MNATESSEQSVTYWIGNLKGGDSGAPRQIWERYFGRLVRLARQMLQGFPRRVADEEDVALSALHSLCNVLYFPVLSMNSP